MITRSKRKLRFESLEARQMLSGNVMVLPHGNSLVVVGDTAGNQVTIAPTANAGEVSVAVNGGQANTFAGISGIVIVMAGGNNSVTVGSSTGGTLNLSKGLAIGTGAGNDTVALIGVNTALGLITGGGNDTVTISRSVLAAADVALGSGDDVLNLNMTTIAAGSLDGGVGSNDQLNKTRTILPAAVTVTGFEVVPAGLTSAGSAALAVLGQQTPLKPLSPRVVDLLLTT